MMRLNSTSSNGVMLTVGLVVFLLALQTEISEVNSFHVSSLESLKYSPFATRKQQSASELKALPAFDRYEFEDDDDDDDDYDDDDDMIDPDSLGDWRNFRRNLAASTTTVGTIDDDGMKSDSGIEDPNKTSTAGVVSKENQEILTSQSRDLAEEYKKVWAHTTSTPEVGGLMVRLPLEVELLRNYRHSIIGKKLRKKYNIGTDGESTDVDKIKEVTSFYSKAQNLIEEEMHEIANMADDSGQIDSSTLTDESTEMLQLYLDNQETWQEVCLVLEKKEATPGASALSELGVASDISSIEDLLSSSSSFDVSDDEPQAVALVLNRPMAFKLTETIARLVLYGASSAISSSPGSRLRPRKSAGDDDDDEVDLIQFLLAFGEECAVYVGGPDAQDEPATIIHGHKEIPGAVEISPGTGIYRGGKMNDIIRGVLNGKYKALDFRFFAGKHVYEESSTMDISVVLGKYQPIACARTLPLKQCISLPKPLWHEVLELCGGEMMKISSLELMKKDDMKFHVVDDDDLLDELDELEKFDDEDDDYY